MQNKTVNLRDKLKKIQDEMDLFKSATPVDYKDFFRQIKEDYGIEID